MGVNTAIQDKVANIRKRLIKTRQEIEKVSTASANARKPVALDQQMVGRISRMDSMQDQEMQLETERRRQIEIKRIDSALKRLDNHEYGNCVICGDKIEKKRLKNDPIVSTCVGCAKT